MRSLNHPKEALILSRNPGPVGGRGRAHDRLSPNTVASRVRAELREPRGGVEARGTAACP
jgi:hypothetical protein